MSPKMFFDKSVNYKMKSPKTDVKGAWHAN